MFVFYCDHLVLPLPADHAFPMSKYSGLREHLVADRVVDAGQLRVPEPADWEDLRPVHSVEYLTLDLLGA